MINNKELLILRFTSLEISQRLKEIGISQDNASLYWCENSWLVQYNEETREEKIIETKITLSHPHQLYKPPLQNWASFNAEDLLQFLPTEIITEKECKDGITQMRHYLRTWRVFDLDNEETWSAMYIDSFCISSSTLVNALGEMLIYLLENKLMGLPNEKSPD